MCFQIVNIRKWQRYGHVLAGRWWPWSRTVLAPSLPQVGLLSVRPVRRPVLCEQQFCKSPTWVNALMLPWLYSPGISDEIFKAAFLLQFIINSLERKTFKCSESFTAQCFVLDPLCWYLWRYQRVGCQSLFIALAGGDGQRACGSALVVDGRCCV